MTSENNIGGMVKNGNAIDVPLHQVSTQHLHCLYSKAIVVRLKYILVGEMAKH